MFGLFGNPSGLSAEDSARLRRVEAKLDQILTHLGLEPMEEDFPPAARDAARAGNKIEAIKAYRAVTGVGLKEAKEAVEDYMLRHPRS